MGYQEIPDSSTASGLSRFSLPYDQFIATNNRLSERYKTESNPAIKREISAHLFALDLPLFRAWQVFGEENQEDYEQEAFILFQRALEAFTPSRGAFVNYLQSFTVGKARRNTFGQAKKYFKIAEAAAANASESGDDDSDQAHDPLFWAKIKRVTTPQQWACLEPRLFQGKTPEEIADLLGTTVPIVRARLHDGLSAIKLEMAKGSQRNVQGAAKTTEDGSEWVTRQTLAQRLSLTRRYVSWLLSPSVAIRTCTYRIDPRDILPINGCRIRFLERPAEGLVHPRFLRRKTFGPPPL